MSAVEHNSETTDVRRFGAVRVLLLLVAACLLALIGAAGVAWYLNSSPQQAAATETAFSVNRGESVAAIARRLQQRGVIRSGRFLTLLSVVQGTQNYFQSGNYLLDPTMTAVEIHDYLVSGRQQLVRVTIPEGWTIRRIAEHLQSNSIVSAADFTAAAGSRELLQSFSIDADSAQGFLFPDTYYFHQDYPADAVVRHMIETFLRAARDIYPDLDSLSAAELYDYVILASIIEREYIAADEAPLMASVFYNRLNAGKRLESCATVVYVMTEEQGLPHPSRLFYRDLERRSAYNTYLNHGLPPAPISNPGHNALRGAFHPADTDYWFFVLRGESADRHHFSRNLQEHNRASVLYLRTPR